MHQHLFGGDEVGVVGVDFEIVYGRLAGVKGDGDNGGGIPVEGFDDVSRLQCRSIHPARTFHPERMFRGGLDHEAFGRFRKRIRIRPIHNFQFEQDQFRDGAREGLGDKGVWS